MVHPPVENSFKDAFVGAGYKCNKSNQCIRVAENSTLHWHMQKGHDNCTGHTYPLFRQSSQLPTLFRSSSTQTRTTNANTLLKCTLHIFFRIVCLWWYQFKEKKGLNLTTKIHIFDPENKQKLDINKASLHLQEKYARCNVSQVMCQTKECATHQRAVSRV